jgi:hypothetical protein
MGIDQRRYLRWCAITGMSLPFLVVLLNWGWLPSLSAAYYTGARDVFVGSLFVMGGALGFYEGYDHRDRLASAIAGAAAPLIATLPMAPAAATTLQAIQGWGHFASALAFFGALWWLCNRLFPLGSAEPTPEKLKRNLVYRIASDVILWGIVGMAVVSVALDNSPWVFWIEAMMVEAFGVAFLVKSGFLLADKPAIASPEPAK